MERILEQANPLTASFNFFQPTLRLQMTFFHS